jgi:AraC-like DNA-binding protein
MKMAEKNTSLYKMSAMRLEYFDGLSFRASEHLPRCPAWIDRSFGVWALNYAHGGRVAWLRSDGRRLTLQAPVAWWTWPGTRFVYGRLGAETWDHYYVTFAGPRAYRMLREGLLPRLRNQAYADVADADEFRGRFERLLALLRAPVPVTAQAVHVLEGMFLSLMTARLPAQEPSGANRAIDELVRTIRAEPARAFHLDAAAATLALSPAHLRRVFKRRTGLSPHQLVLAARLDAAAKLLREGDVPVKRVAASSGYHDVYHFTKAFKGRHGLPPATYRRDIQSLHEPGAAARIGRVANDQSAKPPRRATASRRRPARSG